MPYVGGVGPYRQACEKIAASGYGGFSFDGSPVALTDEVAEFTYQAAAVVSDTSP